MLSDLSAGFGTLAWFIEQTASTLFGLLVVFLGGWAVARGRQISAWLNKKIPAAVQWLRQHRPGAIRRFFRGRKRKDLLWIRANRFDEMSIQRNVSRGHTCSIIFLLWFGLWIMALGMRESFLVSEAPLSKQPGVTIAAATPMYLFEIAWLYYSLTADKLIAYRKRVKIWRWWH
ncbi:hypothetical protein ACI2KX_16030 [Ectopseudomonas khazarica]|uniref:hypothetical protein n=1 Tax=Ectopseudomonas khazarica TaxID=2502979 RepID=UPI00384B5418